MRVHLRLARQLLIRAPSAKSWKRLFVLVQALSLWWALPLVLLRRREQIEPLRLPRRPAFRYFCAPLGPVSPSDAGAVVIPTWHDDVAPIIAIIVSDVISGYCSVPFDEFCPSSRCQP